MTGQRFNDRKKVWSAKWNVLYGPSLYKGTWKVRISHSAASACKELKSLAPSLSCRGRSFFRTRMPSSCPTWAILLPTLPTPMMPNVNSDSCTPLSCCNNSKADCTYWATDAELHPGALVQAMPASRQYSVSIWSKPMVAVAMKRTLLPSSNSLLQRVRVRIISASASLTLTAPRTPSS